VTVPVCGVVGDVSVRTDMIYRAGVGDCGATAIGRGVGTDATHEYDSRRLKHW